LLNVKTVGASPNQEALKYVFHGLTKSFHKDNQEAITMPDIAQWHVKQSQMAVLSQRSAGKFTKKFKVTQTLLSSISKFLPNNTSNPKRHMRKEEGEVQNSCHQLISHATVSRAFHQRRTVIHHLARPR